jgi:hypothetical protein
MALPTCPFQNLRTRSYVHSFLLIMCFAKIYRKSDRRNYLAHKANERFQTPPLQRPHCNCSILYRSRSTTSNNEHFCILQRRTLRFCAWPAKWCDAIFPFGVPKLCGSFEIMAAKRLHSRKCSLVSFFYLSCKYVFSFYSSRRLILFDSGACTISTFLYLTDSGRFPRWVAIARWIFRYRRRNVNQKYRCESTG